MNLHYSVDVLGHIFWLSWMEVQVFWVRFLAFSSFLGWSSKDEAEPHPERVKECYIQCQLFIWGGNSCTTLQVCSEIFEQVNTTTCTIYWQLTGKQYNRHKSAKSWHRYLQPWFHLFWQNVYAANRNMVDDGSCRVFQDPQITSDDLLLLKILFVIQHMKNNFPVGLQRATCRLRS